MGIFSGCLLASDYDGTLANSKGQIDKEVQDAIKYFTAEGGYFTVCTGRTKQGFHAYSPELMNAPILLANGSMAYDYGTDKIVFLDGIEIIVTDVSLKNIYFCCSDRGSVTAGCYLNALCGGISSLIKLTGKILNRKNSAVGLGKGIGSNVKLYLRENGLNGFIEEFFGNVFNIISVEQTNACKTFYAQQICKL